MKQAKPVRPRTLGPPSQAGPAQDPWPPKPSRPGPGPLAPQAKPARPRTLGPPAKPARPGPGPLAPQAKPVRPRTHGPPSQAGPAQDPWPPEPSRSGPMDLGLARVGTGIVHLFNTWQKSSKPKKAGGEGDNILSAFLEKHINASFFL